MFIIVCAGAKLTWQPPTSLLGSKSEKISSLDEVLFAFKFSGTCSESFFEYFYELRRSSTTMTERGNRSCADSGLIYWTGLGINISAFLSLNGGHDVENPLNALSDLRGKKSIHEL